MPDDPAQDRGRPACRASCSNGRNAMKHLTLLAAAAALALSAGIVDGPGQEAGGDRGEGPRQPLLRGDPPGLREVELRERRQRVRVLLHRPRLDLRRGRRGADHPGHAREADDRGDRHLAVERAAARADGEVVAATDDPGDDHRRRLHQGGRRASARPTSAPTTTPMGFRIGEYIKEKKPDGGTICTIEGNPAADNILRRAQGMRDALTGTGGPRDARRRRGSGGWTEVAGCPVFTNDDGAKGVQAMTDILAANPDLDAFGIMGGWPLFGAPQPYRDLFKPLADRIASRRLRDRRRRHHRRGGGDRQGGPRHRARRPAAVRDGLHGARR